MPPLVLFNKEWRIGTDDFVYPSIIELLVRSGWVVGLSLVLGFHVRELEDLQCMGKEYKFTTAYLVLAFILQIIASVNLFFLAFHSSRGRIFDKSSPHPRRHVSTLILFNIVLTFGEFILTFAGTFFAIKDLLRCYSEESERVVIIIILVIISFSYFLLILKMAVALSVIRPFSRVIPEEQRQLLSVREAAQMHESELTYRGLRCLNPCTNDENTIEAFREISQLLSKIFHDGDLVPSDILAGLLLLHYKHRKEDSERKSLIHKTPFAQASAGDISELKYFFKYSVAAYGCWWYLVDGPCTNLCSMAPFINYCSCFPCTQPQGGMVEGDGCCLCNMAAAKSMLGIQQEDFVVFDNRNRIQEVPYFMTVDSERRSLVIAIRGTLSISDMFTDLRGEPGPLGEGIPGLNLNPEYRAHKGMVAAARYVFCRLQGLPLSEKEERNQDRSSRVDILGLSLAQFQDYSVVVTGHSLGAGTAAILAFLLREQHPTRDIRCLAYSPPGGLLSPEAAVESEKFTLSLIVGDDVIPRTSLQNIAKLSYDIRTICESCELPKYKLLGHGLVAFCCCVKSTLILEEVERICEETRREQEEERREQEMEIEPISPFRTRLAMSETSAPDTPLSDKSDTTLLTAVEGEEARRRLWTEEEEARRRRPLTASHMEPMHLPGRVLYLEEREDSSCSISSKDRVSFSRILVSPRMVSDHLPNYINRVLDKL